MDVCIICYNEFPQDDLVLCDKCKNYYCVNCIRTWNQSKDNISIPCPYCTNTFNNNIYSIIYKINRFGVYKIQKLKEMNIYSNLITPVFEKFGEFLFKINLSEYPLLNGNYRYRLFNSYSLYHQLTQPGWDGDTILITEPYKDHDSLFDINMLKLAIESDQVPFTFPFSLSQPYINRNVKLYANILKPKIDVELFKELFIIMGIDNIVDNKILETVPENRLSNLIVENGYDFEVILDHFISKYDWNQRKSSFHVNIPNNVLGICKNGSCRGVVRLSVNANYKCESCNRKYCQFCFTQIEGRHLCKSVDMDDYNEIKSKNFICPCCGLNCPKISPLTFYCNKCHQYYDVHYNLGKTVIKYFRQISTIYTLTQYYVKVAGGFENLVNDIEHLMETVNKFSFKHIFNNQKWHSFIYGKMVKLSISMFKLIKNAKLGKDFIMRIKPIFLNHFNEKFLTYHEYMRYGKIKVFNNDIIEYIGKSGLSDPEFIFEYIKSDILNAAKLIAKTNYWKRFKRSFKNDNEIFDCLLPLVDGIIKLKEIEIDDKSIFSNPQIKSIIDKIHEILVEFEVDKSLIKNDKLKLLKRFDENNELVEVF